MEKTYYLMDTNNDYLTHDTNEMQFIQDVKYHLKNDIALQVENYKTYTMHVSEFLNEMAYLNTLYQRVETIDNIVDAMVIVEQMDMKINMEVL